MGKKAIFFLIFGLILLYPAAILFQLEALFGKSSNEEQVLQTLNNFQISLWISWSVMVTVAIVHKWKYRKNILFWLVYTFLGIGFGVFGVYSQMIANHLEIATGFHDGYTFGVLIALKNIVAAVVLTAILQACVWWFTRRWHRR